MLMFRFSEPLDFVLVLSWSVFSLDEWTLDVTWVFSVMVLSISLQQITFMSVHLNLWSSEKKFVLLYAHFLFSEKITVRPFYCNNDMPFYSTKQKSSIHVMIRAHIIIEVEFGNINILEKAFFISVNYFSIIHILLKWCFFGESYFLEKGKLFIIPILLILSN